MWPFSWRRSLEEARRRIADLELLRDLQAEIIASQRTSIGQLTDLLLKRCAICGQLHAPLDFEHRKTLRTSIPKDSRSSR